MTESSTQPVDPPVYIIPLASIGASARHASSLPQRSSSGGTLRKCPTTPRQNRAAQRGRCASDLPLQPPNRTSSAHSMSQKASLGVSARAVVRQPVLGFLQRLPALLKQVLAGRGSMPNGMARGAVLASISVFLGLRALGMLPRRGATAGGGEKRANVAPLHAGIVWIRSDLRVSDHEALAAAATECSNLVPLYCFDPCEYGKDASSFERTGPGRASFIVESVNNLRQQLRGLGSDLVVRVGRPQDVLPRLAAQAGAQAVYCHSEVSAEAVQVESSTRAALQCMGVQLKMFWGGSTLFHAEDLPFERSAVPSSYAHFGDALANVPVRAPLPSPTMLNGLPVGSCIDAGEVPSLEQLGFAREATQLFSLGPRPVNGLGTGRLRGGEQEALRHLQAFISDVKEAHARCKGGADLQGENAGPVFSCKISPWLALGCVSPRTVYHEMRQQLGMAGRCQGEEHQQPGSKEQDERQQDSLGSNWLLFELLWRDFFRFRSSSVPNPVSALQPS